MSSTRYAKVSRVMLVGDAPRVQAQVAR